MKKHLPLYPILFLLSFIFSCNGQQKIEQPKESIDKADKSTEAETPEQNYIFEKDPYFSGTQIVHSTHGPKSITRNIIQDRKGDFWLATWEGIVHYNPKEGFTNYTNKEGLRRYRVFAILEDTKGDIWFGTVGAGLYRFDGKSFTNITMQEGLVHNSIGCIMEDKAGNIWIGTQGGISKYDGTSFTNFTMKEGLTDDDINSILEDQNGRFWIGTRGNACSFDGKEFTKIVNQEAQPLVNVRSIIEDQEGNIWFGGNDGLIRFNGLIFTSFTKNFVGYIYEDKDHNIWTNSSVNSDGNSNSWAISRYDKNALQNEEALPTEIKAAENMFFGIMEDKDRNIWFGSLSGVYKYDGESFDDFNE